MNKVPFGLRKFVYRGLDSMGYLEDNKYAGCLMFASPGRVIHDNNGMVGYDANTFPGQSGGNGVEEIIFSSHGEQDHRVMLDFLHTLRGKTPDNGNMGVKIEGNISEQILKWVKSAKLDVDEIIAKTAFHGKGSFIASEKEVMVRQMLEDKLPISAIKKYSNMSEEEIKKIQSTLGKSNF